ncbi:SRPBCC family protein [Brevibacterium luteolum]|uniref:Carbon monoxide dehydrogenase n=1 Tax=Brevibacterium luteolum TaxID=199591 RepID=A0A6G8KT26_9MICO|nr:carbon monoxide dehydrogenase subunit G [Brevibacterium luteolum]QIN27938.1 carbon monoxide dehydrogenase [Brevibacterium luteolum]
MKISSTATMNADPQTAWDAFHNEKTLAATIPGVQSFTDAGDGKYAVVVTMGVAAIKGTYNGTVVFSEEREPEFFVLTVNGAGGPGTIGAEVAVQLSAAEGGGSTVNWEADAILGGPIGGVGQRMLSGVAKRIATKFFADIDRAIADGVPEADEQAGPDAEASATSAAAGVGSQGTGGGFLTGMAAGAGIALLGVAVGAIVNGRR